MKIFKYEKSILLTLLMFIELFYLGCYNDKEFLRNGLVETAKIIDTPASEVKIKDKKEVKTFEKCDISKIIIKKDTIEYKLSHSDSIHIRAEEDRKNLCTKHFECANYRDCDSQLTRICYHIDNSKNCEYMICENIIAKIQIVEIDNKIIPTGGWGPFPYDEYTQTRYSIKILEIIDGNSEIDTEKTYIWLYSGNRPGIFKMNNQDFIAEMAMSLHIENCATKEIELFYIDKVYVKPESFNYYKLVHGHIYAPYYNSQNLYTLEEIKNQLHNKAAPIKNSEKTVVKERKNLRKPILFATSFVLVNFLIFVFPFLIL